MQIDRENKLCLVDVGGADGLPPKWHPVRDRLFPVQFEPNPEEAQKLRAGDGGLVIEAALSNITERHNLTITLNKHCNSLLKPNEALLSNYNIRGHFNVVGSLGVDCVRYDGLYQKGLVPIPDVIKIDTQGFEFQVLMGFGGLLQDVLAIELEAHFYPLYRDQKLLHDLIGLLDGFGFVLRKLVPIDHFDGDLVEADAYFTKQRHRLNNIPDNQKWKIDIINKVLQLPPYPP